ncbi:GlcNAc-PI de-N-acetylase [Rhodococcoides trifolii]|uniref:GlcNAc-PI de-N-acetylase n=1 Tax=Rhodococcoides trifolii TaxID=908250 RepID=A0A917FZN1_9NOCA|nr:PIG-L family deacetylase [Rhodococcus trifolii]GGG15529.1 GlcNAc-PI de-N-acetylase [Rhodococcus trifolii]
MSVLVCFHAHPDDEVFNTGGVMRLAADAGHRVVLVTATDGALGEYPEGILAPGQSLADRRRLELEESARVLGADRVVMLGYADSGMAGTEDNSNPVAFANVDRDTASRRLADILTEERTDVLTIYDANGGYGHPDHIRVHDVGVRAAEIAGIENVYESTVNRDHFRELVKANPAWEENDSSVPDIEQMGLPADQITTAVNVVAAMPAKRAAMHAHATQIGDFGPFRDMPDEQLAAAFGTEWFRRVGAPAGTKETALPL